MLVKLGTYPATLTASDWLRILTAIDEKVESLTKQNCTYTAEDYTRTKRRLLEQIGE